MYEYVQKLFTLANIRSWWECVSCQLRRRFRAFRFIQDRGMIEQASSANRLLRAMQPHDFDAVTRGASLVEMTRGSGLAVARDRITYSWFPLSGMISLVAESFAGAQAEVGMAGVEGFVSTSTLLGCSRSGTRMLVQLNGSALRVNAAVVQNAMRNSQHLSRLLLGYVEAFLQQAFSSALAYAQLTVSQRLARWLLMCGDRVGDVGIGLTHEAMSIMLGSRRAGITEAVGELERVGAIQTSRGRLSILDRPLLVARASGCYGDAEAAYESMLAVLQPPAC